MFYIIITLGIILCSFSPMFWLSKNIFLLFWPLNHSFIRMLLYINSYFLLATKMYFCFFLAYVAVLEKLVGSLTAVLWKTVCIRSLVTWWLSLSSWYSTVSLGVTRCESSRPLKSPQLLQLYSSPHCPPPIFLYICKNVCYLNSLLYFLFYFNNFHLVRFIWEIFIPYQHHCISFKVAISVSLTVYSTY